MLRTLTILLRSSKLALFLLSIFLTSATLIFAQTDKLDLSVSPLFFEFSTEKGAAIKDKIRVRNNSASPISLRVGLQRLAPGQNSEATLADPKPEDEFVSWVKLESQSISARPREWTEIPFTISIPQDAAFGYYFAFLLTQSPPQQEAGTAKVTGGVAVPVLLNVKAPGAIASGKLIEFKPKASFYDYLPATFITRFSNTGNVHIKPRGNIFIKNAFTARQVGILEVNPEMGSILPGASRSFESQWNESFIVREPVIEDGKTVLTKDGKPKTSLKVNWDKILSLRIGKYNATALLVVSGADRDYSYEATTSFIVFPYLLVFGALVFLTFASIGMINTARSVIRKVKALFVKAK